ncbi:MAG: FAD-dependent oxidoreductase, partial [Oceanospirillaceae bacterium]
MKQDSVDNHSQAAPALNVAILGAGIVGLNCAFWLQRAGVKVTLIDTEKPGLGASFGNAGLFADYGRLPFANYAMLRKIPKMLLDKQSPLAIDPSYTPQLFRYGTQYFKACRKSRYEAGKRGLLNLHSLAHKADKTIIDATNSQHLISQQGFMGLFSNADSFGNAKPSFKEREQQGVVLKLLDPQQVKELEPQLQLDCAGAVYYPNTSHTIDPSAYCQSIFAHFIAHGGVFMQHKVAQISQTVDQVTLHSAGATHTFDQLVVATGAATKQLVAQLQLHIPQVCERGYHLMLKAGENQITRPIAWMNQGVHMTPMQSGIRVAGTA